MSNSFGKPKVISGKSFVGESTLVPLEVLRRIRPRTPIPTTVTTTAFTVNASVTNKVPIWNGSDIIMLDEALTYTWTASTNSILSSAGAETTQTGCTLGVWYYYVAFSSTNTPVIRPSQTGPSEVQTGFPNGVLAHPGTSITKPWTYVGYQVCSAATTPTLLAATKIGFTYHFADVTVATATTWAELSFPTSLPKLGAVGGKLGGYLETGAAATVTVSSTSSATIGQTIARTTSAGAIIYAPFGPIPMTSNGSLWGNHATAAGDVHITYVVDVV